MERGNIICLRSCPGKFLDKVHFFITQACAGKEGVIIRDYFPYFFCYDLKCLIKSNFLKPPIDFHHRFRDA